MKTGTYNDNVANNMRCGTIPRKQYWDLLPILRKDFRSGLTDEEIDQFIGYAHEEAEREKAGDAYPDNCITGMTARKYF